MIPATSRIRNDVAEKMNVCGNGGAALLFQSGVRFARGGAGGLG